MAFNMKDIKVLSYTRKQVAIKDLSRWQISSCDVRTVHVLYMWQTRREILGEGAYLYDQLFLLINQKLNQSSACNLFGLLVTQHILENRPGVYCVRRKGSVYKGTVQDLEAG
jgi:hypothetical protein